jgi:hypothetical protein
MARTGSRTTPSRNGAAATAAAAATATTRLSARRLRSTCLVASGTARCRGSVTCKQDCSILLCTSLSNITAALPTAHDVPCACVSRVLGFAEPRWCCWIWAAAATVLPGAGPGGLCTAAVCIAAATALTAAVCTSADVLPAPKCSHKWGLAEPLTDNAWRGALM